MIDAPLSRGLFVTGTGTGVGKSIVAAAILYSLRRKGYSAIAFKPVITGFDEPAVDWPNDKVLLAEAQGMGSDADVTPYEYGPAVSPHLAAELAGEAIDPGELRSQLRGRAANHQALVCEGVGGLMVPFRVQPRYDVLDLIVDSGLPAVVATHPGLGTISDTRLTVDRLLSAGVSVSAVVISAWPEAPSIMQESNRSTIAALTGIEVHTLPILEPSEIHSQKAILPAEAWLGNVA